MIVLLSILTQLLISRREECSLVLLPPFEAVNPASGASAQEQAKTPPSSLTIIVLYDLFSLLDVRLSADCSLGYVIDHEK